VARLLHALTVATSLVATSVVASATAGQEPASANRLDGGGGVGEELASRADDAAQRAADYLRSRGTAIDPAVPFTLDYLSRRFGLAPFAEQVVYARAEATRSPDLAALLPLLGDDPGDVPSSDSRFQARLQQALRCAQMDTAGRDALLAAIEEDLGGSHYLVSHAAIALQWMRELRCVPTDRDADLAARAVDGLALMAGTGPASEEPALQAIALLTYIAPDRLPERDVVVAVIEAQRPDGSWARDGDAPHDIDHATMLALWFLLEVSGSPARDVPMNASAPASAPTPAR
jgi:hypothetical protein